MPPARKEGARSGAARRGRKGPSGCTDPMLDDTVRLETLREKMEDLGRKFEALETKKRPEFARHVADNHELLFGDNPYPIEVVFRWLADTDTTASYACLSKMAYEPEGVVPDTARKVLHELHLGKIDAFFGSSEWDGRQALTFERTKFLYSCLPIVRKESKKQFRATILAALDYSPDEKTFAAYLRQAKEMDFHYANYLRVARGFISDKLLPMLIAKAEGPEQLAQYDASIRELAGAFEGPSAYVERFVPILLEGCQCPEDLLREDAELRAHVENWGYYPDKGGYPTWYNDLPAVLSILKSVDARKKFQEMMAEYGERFGYPTNYVRNSLLPMLDGVKDECVVNWLCDLVSRASFCPDYATRNVYPLLYQNGVLNESTFKGLNDIIILSGSKIDENIKLLRSVTPYNVAATVETFKGYVNDIGALYLEGIYEEYAKLPPEERKQFVQKIRTMRRKIAAGEEMDDGSELCRRVQFLTVKSMNLNYESFVGVMKSFEKRDIPAPNFRASTSIILNEKMLEENLDEKDRQRILTLKEAIARSVKQDASKIIVSLSDMFYQQLENPAVKIEGKEKPEALEALKASVAAMDEQARTELLGALLKEISLKVKPSGKAQEHFARLALLYAYRKNRYLRSLADTLEECDPAESTFKLNDLFKELREEKTALGIVIDETGMEKDLSRIIRRLRKGRTGVMRLELIPAKTRLDAFYGSYGETCIASCYDEIMNPAFTPIRLFDGERIVGGIYTMTVEYGGAKYLLLVGVEPKEEIAMRVEAKEFLSKVIVGLKAICKEEKYDYIAATTNSSALSNRHNIAYALRNAMRDKTPIDFGDVMFARYSMRNAVVLSDCF